MTQLPDLYRHSGRGRQRARLAAVGALTVALALPWPAAIAQQSSDFVWCHDAARSIIKRTYAWSCKGEVVSDEQAAAIRDKRTNRLKRILERKPDDAVPGKTLLGSGSGFFISKSGLVLTNNHVVNKCEVLTVAPPGREPEVAEVVRRDRRYDLALLKSTFEVSQPAAFRDTAEVTLGEPVSVVGYPLRGRIVIKPVQVNGHVKKEEQPRHRQVFAMKIDIRLGNSGGPILDESGLVMGVVFAKVNTPAVYSRTGKLIRNVGLGVRNSAVEIFLRNQNVPVPRGRAGKALEPEQLFDVATDFVVQVGCWR